MKKDKLIKANELFERIRDIEHTLHQLNDCIDTVKASEIFITISTKKEYSLMIHEREFSGKDQDSIYKFLKGTLLSELEPLKKEFDLL
jgi:hypothetical protein